MKVQQTLRRDARPTAQGSSVMPTSSSAFHDLAASSTTPIVAFTAGAANVKGAYALISASTADALDQLRITVSTSGTSATNTATLLDIAIGQPGSEVVVIPNLQIGGLAASGVIDVPVHIPAGSRVVGRVQSAVAGKVLTLGIAAGRGVPGTTSPASLDALGVSTATSRGVALNNSGVNNTPGTWTEITAATTQAYQGLILGPDLAADVDIPTGTAVVEVAVGGSGSEVVIGTWQVSMFATESLYIYAAYDLAVNIPAGSRISARVRFASAATASLGVSLLAVPFV